MKEHIVTLRGLLIIIVYISNSYLAHVVELRLDHAPGILDRSLDLRVLFYELLISVYKRMHSWVGIEFNI